MEKIKGFMNLFNKSSISSFVIGVCMVMVGYITVAAVHSELSPSSKEIISKILDRNFDLLFTLLGYIWGKMQGANENIIKSKANEAV